MLTNPTLGVPSATQFHPLVCPVINLSSISETYRTLYQIIISSFLPPCRLLLDGPCLYRYLVTRGLKIACTTAVHTARESSTSVRDVWIFKEVYSTVMRQESEFEERKSSLVAEFGSAKVEYNEIR
jgi:hypothetical protein